MPARVRTEPGAPDRATVPDGDGDVDAPATLGPFAIGPRLGGGGMGVVFRARDTVLGRTVALKVVRPDVRAAGGVGARDRLLREAQALARLKHPNVVTVFTVGSAGDDIFIAMELVEGATVRDWMQTPRDWRRVLDVFVAVGRGLAAVHALGRVHRDVKPSNLFLDRDGTPKVGDFGLVASIEPHDRERDDDADPPAGPGAGVAVGHGSVTVTGAVMGTPAYMAPEQMRGERADARADQYAFCVSLHEALTGQLPDEVARADPHAAAARPIPPRLRPILVRGLAARADDRYPSMEALVAALVRVRRGHLRAWAAVGAAGALVAVATGAWMLARDRAHEDPCPVPTAAIAPVWGDARRGAVRDHVIAVEHELGAARAAAALARVDTYVRGWRDMRVDACHANRVQGTQSDTLLDLRMRCLDRRLTELDDGLVLVGGATTRVGLEGALDGLLTLTPLDRCADTVGLAAATSLPEAPAARAAANQLATELEPLTVRRRAGQVDGLAAQLRAMVERARALGHPPTLAAALSELARAQLYTSDEAGASTTLRELTQVAARAGDARDEAYAWITLLGIAGDDGKLDVARSLEPAASAAVLRAGDPIDLRASLLFEQAVVTQYTPQVGDGVRLLKSARAMLEKAGAGAPTSPYAQLLSRVLIEEGRLQTRAGDLDGGIATIREALVLIRQLYGPASGDEAQALTTLAMRLRSAGQLDAALAAYQDAARILEARTGRTAALAIALEGAGDVQADLHRWDDALATYERAEQIDREVLAPDDPWLRAVRSGRAGVLTSLRRFDEAAAIYDDVVAGAEHANDGTEDLPAYLLGRAEVDASRGRCPHAEADLARAISLFGAIGGSADDLLAEALVWQGRCLVADKRPGDAIAPLERARGLTVTGAAARARTRAGYYLGRAQVESGRDRAAGLALVRQARDALAADHDDAVPEIDRWLATHR